MHAACRACCADHLDFACSAAQEQLEQLAESYEVILTRMQLADDPLGNVILRILRVQM